MYSALIFLYLMTRKPVNFHVANDCETLPYAFCLKFDSSMADLVDPGHTIEKIIRQLTSAQI